MLTMGKATNQYKDSEEEILNRRVPRAVTQPSSRFRKCFELSQCSCSSLELPVRLPCKSTVARYPRSELLMVTQAEFTSRTSLGLSVQTFFCSRPGFPWSFTNVISSAQNSTIISPYSAIDRLFWDPYPSERRAGRACVYEVLHQLFGFVSRTEPRSPRIEREPTDHRWGSGSTVR